MIKMVLKAIVLVIGLQVYLSAAAEQGSCVTCHSGIESIRDPKSQMMQQIKAISSAFGDSGGCVVCHGGNPTATDVKNAHEGAPAGMTLATFVRDPGSMWVVDKTCGQCHADTVYNLKRSLMATEAGKIQGNMYTAGVHTSTKVEYGNYDIDDPDGREPAWGSDVYKKYMVRLMTNYPDQFPTKLKQVPLAPMSEKDVAGKKGKELVALAATTYQRADCQRCHLGVRGRKGRGDWRGMGCSACHIPYGNEGFYEGADTQIDNKTPGHLLVHTIQATREAKVKVNDMEFSGIHPETCNSCHNRGKRIGVSYVGLMEQPYFSPFSQPVDGLKDDVKPPKLHGKYYKHIKDDLHFEAGMTCQDCHTSIDMHGDGTIFGTTLAQVEIECSDCHGTNEKYPWELEIGKGEKFNIKPIEGERGLAKELPYWMTQGTVYKPEDGYLLSARGNPLGNVVKKGDKVIAHLASGADLEVPQLRTKAIKNEWKSVEARVAMNDIKAHMENMECYACHADWAPQCYGCHVKVDYTKGKSKIDWIASGSTHFKNGETLESVIGLKKKKYDLEGGEKGAKLYGSVQETRSFLRWENPILGINGEGLVTPIIPGCQVTYTVIDPEGEMVVGNYQAQVPTTTGDGKTVAGLDMAPVNPHTTGRKARTCASCHTSPKALGYGIGDGLFNTHQADDFYLDITDLKNKKIVTKHKQPQINKIKGMDFDWSQVITREGKQLSNVGTHWPASAPLSQKQRETMEKAGTCLGCHQNMKEKELWNKLNTPDKLDNKEHIYKMHKIFLDASKK